MTVTVTSHRIPADKFGQFHAILCATGGRYSGNPVRVGDVVLTSYEIDDYTGLNQAWERCIRDIREVRRDQPWRALLRRLGFKV